MTAQGVRQVSFTLLPAPSNAICDGSSTAGVACPHKAAWSGHMRYEFDSALRTPVQHAWDACAWHAYRIAQRYHQAIADSDGRSDFALAVKLQFSHPQHFDLSTDGVQQVMFALTPSPSDACRGTAGAPGIACPQTAVWRGHMRYQYASALRPAVEHVWDACTQHAYPIAAWHHQTVAAADSQAAAIAAMERQFEAAAEGARR